MFDVQRSTFDVRRSMFTFALLTRLPGGNIVSTRSSMLTTLRIQNLALVEDLTLELQPGYNAITGETGAGKSILIGALNLVLGERSDKTLVRAGAEGCLVEAVFDIQKAPKSFLQFLESLGVEMGGGNELVIKRSFTLAGTNRQFLNGSPTTVALLARIGEWLVDIHGPHDHQSLLNPGKQLAILDAFGGLEPDVEAFADLMRERAKLAAEKSALVVDERTYAQQLDLARFQRDDIQAARLEPAEEASVEQAFKRAGNAARLLQLSQEMLAQLGDEDGAVLHQTATIGKALAELHRLDPANEELSRLHTQAIGMLREFQAELSRYADTIELEPGRLQQLEERLNLIHSLKRKYGATLKDVIQFGHVAAQRLEQLEQREEILKDIKAREAKLQQSILLAGKALSRRRADLAPRLSKAVMKELSDLGFKQSRFQISLTQASNDAEEPATATSTGLDKVEFQFAPNPGEPSRPLRAIASSGELARVMLALKTVLAAVDQVPVLIFDEVDANVGGETARAVGDKMRRIAASRQVLCITHLPQVAASADSHYVVKKQLKAGRTLSDITLLDGQERVAELARMLGGQTEAARTHAEAMLAEVGD
jgi:DNA repair protein RecN (Recombination protein N)